MDSVRGAVVLCGGRSARMGRDKATLPFGRETLLERTVRVVASRGQTLPPLPDAARVVFDEVDDRGPLGGLGPGLRAVDPELLALTNRNTPESYAAALARSARDRG